VTLNANAGRCASRAGFSLLEVVVAVGVLALMMIGVAMVFKDTGFVASSEAKSNDVARTSQGALDQMTKELRESAIRVITVSADGSSIQFQIPVDIDGNGTILDGSGAVEYGFLDRGVPTKGTITYRFVENIVGGRPDVLREADLRLDLNGDGDRLDSFDRGCIVRITHANGGPEVRGPALTGQCVVVAHADWGGDIDGDGVADPIFKLDGATGRVQINVWTMLADDRKNPQMLRSSSSVCPRNK
jgi:type II secretory pathway pseudopilin PulG